MVHCVYWGGGVTDDNFRKYFEFLFLNIDFILAIGADTDEMSLNAA